MAKKKQEVTQDWEWAKAQMAEGFYVQADEWDENEWCVRKDGVIYDQNGGECTEDDFAHWATWHVIDPPTNSKVKVVKGSRSLRVDLTEDELRQVAEKMAEANDRAVGLEAQKKAMTADFKAKIDSAAAEMHEQCTLYRNKYDYRDVATEERHDFENDTITVVRLDTNEVIEERPMMSWEKQLPIPGAEASKGADDDEVSEEVGEEAEREQAV